MSRMKKPLDETFEEARVRTVFESIANHANRSEKMSWGRKMDNMNKLVKELVPYQEKILELTAQQQPILDEIAILRQEMVDECIHPFEFLVFKETHVLCKFCNRKLNSSMLQQSDDK